MSVFLWQEAESGAFDQIRSRSPQQNREMILEVVRPLSRLCLVKSEGSKGSNTPYSKLFFFLADLHKSICICHCLLLSCRESPLVFISVSISA